MSVIDGAVERLTRVRMHLRQDRPALVVDPVAECEDIFERDVRVGPVTGGRYRPDIAHDRDPLAQIAYPHAVAFRVLFATLAQHLLRRRKMRRTHLVADPSARASQPRASRAWMMCWQITGSESECTSAITGPCDW